MKKFVAGLLAGIILAASTAVMAAESHMTISVIMNRVKLAVNGVMTETPTLLYEGRTYVQLHGAAEAFGADLVWDGTTNTASLTTKATPGRTASTVVAVQALLKDYLDVVEVVPLEGEMILVAPKNYLRAGVGVAYAPIVLYSADGAGFYLDLSILGSNYVAIESISFNSLRYMVDGDMRSQEEVGQGVIDSMAGVFLTDSQAATLKKEVSGISNPTVQIAPSSNKGTMSASDKAVVRKMIECYELLK